MVKRTEISKKVKKYRQLKNMTQARLAELADISTIHLSHIETGAVSMSLECLLKICEILEITPNHLLLADFHVEKDSYLLKEHLEALTDDEKQFLIRIMELLKELKVNRDLLQN